VNTSDIEVKFSTRAPEALVFYSEQSDLFKEQFDIVLSSKNIFVPDGSAFLVNGFISRGATIVVLGSTLVPYQCQKYEKMKLIYLKIEETNSILFVTCHDNVFKFEKIRPFIEKTFFSCLSYKSYSLVLNCIRQSSPEGYLFFENSKQPHPYINCNVYSKLQFVSGA
jgi:hypothetical protein